MSSRYLLCGLGLVLSTLLTQIAVGHQAVDQPVSQLTNQNERPLPSSSVNYGATRTGLDEAEDTTIYKVVVNHEERYSIWPAARENPLGWNDAGKTGTKEECLAYIEAMGKEKRPASLSPAPADFQIPSFGQNGRSVEIKGPFDGDIRTTEIRIGGQLVTALAESSKSCFFISPVDKFGPTEITLKENNVQTKANYRNIGVRLSAPKTNLLKGESTTVTITVEGLNGIKQNIPLLLEKKGDVSIEGGDVQTIQIRPSEVVIEGAYAKADVRKLVVGLRPGIFNITATVIDPSRRPIIIPLFENGTVNSVRVKKDGDGFVVDVENVRNPLKGDPVDGEHKLEYRCPQLSKLPYIQNLFLNKGKGRGKSECLILITPRIIITNEE